MFLILFFLFQISSTIDSKDHLAPREDYHSRLTNACIIYEEAVSSLFDDILNLIRDTLHYVFVRWPELPPPSGPEKIVDKDTLARGSLVLEKSLLRVQALVVKDIGDVLDEIAEAINLTALLEKVKATGFKLHVL